MQAFPWNTDKLHNTYPIMISRVHDNTWKNHTRYHPAKLFIHELFSDLKNMQWRA
jgi:hypothetical protein